MGKKGFTLTELLAAIIIIGILVVIAIPVYNKQIAKSKTKVYETYESNLKDSTNTFVLNCISKNKCDTGETVDYYEDYANGVRVEDLVEQNYIIELKDPAGNGKCTGSVYVGNHDDPTREKDLEYKYEVCLMCSEYESEVCKNFSFVTTSISKRSSTYEASNGDLVAKSGKVKFKVSGYSDLLEFEPAATCTRITNSKNEANCTTSKNQNNDFTIKATHKLSKKITEKNVHIDSVNPTAEGIITLSNNGEDGWSKSKTLKVTIGDEFDDPNNKLKYSFDDGTTWADSVRGATVEREYTTSETVKFKVKDAAGNIGGSDFNIEKVNYISPVVSISGLSNNVAKNHNIKVTVANLTELASGYEQKLFLSTSQSPSSVSNLVTYVNDKNMTVGDSNSNGTYYIFVKQIKDKAGNYSSGGTLVTISGVKYHRFGTLIFDNTGPTGCTINLSNAGKTPYVDMTVSGGSSDLAGYSWENTTDGSKYSKSNTKKTVYANGTYNVYAIDTLGNKSTCATKKITNIDGTAPQISYAFSGNHNNACYYGSATITANVTSSTINISKFERWTNNNTGQNYFVNNSVNSKTTSNSITLSSTGSYFMNSRAIIILPNSSSIVASSNSSQITVDASAPYTPYLSVSQSKTLPRHKSAFSVSNCGSTTSSGNVSCSIEYLDYCLGSHNSLSFTFYVTDVGCSGISKFQYSTNGSSWSDANSSSINSNLGSVVSSLNSGCKEKEQTVYVRAIDNTGRASNVLSIRLKRIIA